MRNKTVAAPKEFWAEACSEQGGSHSLSMAHTEWRLGPAVVDFYHADARAVIQPR